MFIAVINEGFSIAEAEKHKQQLKRFIRQTQPLRDDVSWISRLNPYRYLKDRPKAAKTGNLPGNLVLPLQKTVVRDFMSGSAGSVSLRPSWHDLS